MTHDPNSALIAKIIAEDNQYAVATGMSYATYSESSDDNDEEDDEYGPSKKYQKKKQKRSSIPRVKTKLDSHVSNDDNGGSLSECSIENSAVNLNCKSEHTNGEAEGSKHKKNKQPRRWSDEEDRIFKLVIFFLTTC